MFPQAHAKQNNLINNLPVQNMNAVYPNYPNFPTQTAVTSDRINKPNAIPRNINTSLSIQSEVVANKSYNPPLNNPSNVPQAIQPQQFQPLTHSVHTKIPYLGAPQTIISSPQNLGSMQVHPFSQDSRYPLAQKQQTTYNQYLPQPGVVPNTTGWINPIQYHQQVVNHPQQPFLYSQTPSQQALNCQQSPSQPFFYHQQPQLLSPQSLQHQSPQEYGNKSSSYPFMHPSNYQNLASNNIQHPEVRFPNINESGMATPFGVTESVDRSVQFNFNSRFVSGGHLNPKVPKRYPVVGSLVWTEADDNLLKKLKLEKKMQWKKIGMYFPGRSINACQCRLKRLVKSKTKSFETNEESNE